MTAHFIKPSDKKMERREMILKCILGKLSVNPAKSLKKETKIV